jgi:hypothetical protein
MTNKFILKQSLRILIGTAVAVGLMMFCLWLMNIAFTLAFLVGGIGLVMTGIYFILFIKDECVRIVNEINKNEDKEQI